MQLLQEFQETILGTVANIFELCQFLKITKGAVKIGCDNTAAIAMASNMNKPISTKTSDYDFLGTIHSILESCTIKWNWIHVRGHQVDENDRSEITREELLNCEMDCMTKQELARILH
jgi:hypothetical protein